MTPSQGEGGTERKEETAPMRGLILGDHERNGTRLQTRHWWGLPASVSCDQSRGRGKQKRRGQKSVLAFEFGLYSVTQEARLPSPSALVRVRGSD